MTDTKIEELTRISIHALLAESDLSILTLPPFVRISIHALLAESDSIVISFIASPMHFYPRSPCGERLGGHAPGLNLCAISIHALLAESDAEKLNNSLTIKLFLSTLSLRRATARL